jgi:hypothetical protein
VQAVHGAGRRLAQAFHRSIRAALPQVAWIRPRGARAGGADHRNRLWAWLASGEHLDMNPSQVVRDLL